MCANCMGMKYQSRKPRQLSTRDGYSDWCERCADSVEAWCEEGRRAQTVRDAVAMDKLIDDAEELGIGVKVEIVY